MRLKITRLHLNEFVKYIFEDLVYELMIRIFCFFEYLVMVLIYFLDFVGFRVFVFILGKHLFFDKPRLLYTFRNFYKNIVIDGFKVLVLGINM